MLIWVFKESSGRTQCGYGRIKNYWNFKKYKKISLFPYFYYIAYEVKRKISILLGWISIFWHEILHAVLFYDREKIWIFQIINLSAESNGEFLQLNKLIFIGPIVSCSSIEPQWRWFTIIDRLRFVSKRVSKYEKQLANITYAIEQ